MSDTMMVSILPTYLYDMSPNGQKTVQRCHSDVHKIYIYRYHHFIGHKRYATLPPFFHNRSVTTDMKMFPMPFLHLHTV
jgi:hypothetical protein